MKNFLTLITVLTLVAALLAGCSTSLNSAAAFTSPGGEAQTQQLSPETARTGGVLFLKINPEIALHYDETGKVTKLEGRNADGVRILEDFTDYAGKDAPQVLEELVDLIGKAGYFVEEADGTARKIVLELDPGSQVPHDRFLEDMAAHVKACVESQSRVGEREYDYDNPVQETAPSAGTTTGTNKTASVPTGLCPICADDDCDDGNYCDDADEKAENLREYENRKNGVHCPVCGDYDCDDGAQCDDWGDRYDDDWDDD